VLTRRARWRSKVRGLQRDASVPLLYLGGTALVFLAFGAWFIPAGE